MGHSILSNGVIFDIETVTLEPYQQIVIDSYHHNVIDYRKPWESSYEPKFQTRSSVPTHNEPSESSLPAGRYVILRDDRLPDDYESIEKTILPWIREMGLKLLRHFSVRCNDGKHRTAFLFRSRKAALIFKLAWG